MTVAVAEAVQASPVRVALISAGEIYGGVERFLSTFSVRLQESNDGVPLVVLFHGGRLATELAKSHVRVVVSPFEGKYDPRAIRWLASLLKDEMIDVVHAHGYKAAVIGGVAARIAGVAAVKTEHGALEPFRGLAALKMRTNLWLDGWITARLFEESVYITSDLFSKLARGGRRGARVIWNGLAPIERNGIHRSKQNGAFHVGIVGRLSPVKGHDVLFAAVRRAANRKRIHIDIFGDGPLESELKNQSQDLGSGVTFHGFTDDIVEAMANLDCLAMPSRNEGLPYTLLEAMHLGLPIVASHIGGMREILDNGRTALLFAPEDADALARHLDRLCDEPNVGVRLGENAKERARCDFEIDTMVDSYVRLYREVSR